MNSIRDVFDALDLFYANKHMYDRLLQADAKRNSDTKNHLKQHRKEQKNANFNNI